MKEIFTVPKYPLTVWCVNCGLIAFGDPIMNGIDFDQCEARIKWVNKSIELGTPEIRREGRRAYFLCPNCNPKLDSPVLFRDVRFRIPTWRYNVRVDPFYPYGLFGGLFGAISIDELRDYFVEYELIEKVVMRFFNKRYFEETGIQFKEEYIYFLD